MMFFGVTATEYYPAENITWTEEFMQNYGGIITWVPYSACDLGHAEVIDAAVAATCTKDGLTEGSHFPRWWHHLGGELDGYNTDTLSFVAIPAREALFMCKVTDGSGTSVWSGAARMKVLSAELKITSQPENFTGTIGDTASFTVGAEGDTLRYRWYLSSDGGTTWSECWLDGYNTNTLSFYVNAGRAANLYKCVITDIAGNTITSNTVSIVTE